MTRLTPDKKQELYDNDGCFYCRVPHADHTCQNCPERPSVNRVDNDDDEIEDCSDEDGADYEGVYSITAVINAQPKKTKLAFDFTIVATVKGHNARLLIDTGSSGTFLSKDFYNKHEKDIKSI